MPRGFFVHMRASASLMLLDNDPGNDDNKDDDDNHDGDNDDDNSDHRAESAE